MIQRPRPDHTYSFCLQVLCSRPLLHLSSRTISSIGGHVWVCLLTLLRTSTKVPVLALVVELDCFIGFIKYFVFHLRKPREKPCVSFLIKDV